MYCALCPHKAISLLWLCGRGNNLSFVYTLLGYHCVALCAYSLESICFRFVTKAHSSYTTCKVPNAYYLHVYSCLLIVELYSVSQGKYTGSWALDPLRNSVPLSCNCAPKEEGQLAEGPVSCGVLLLASNLSLMWVDYYTALFLHWTKLRGRALIHLWMLSTVELQTMEAWDLRTRAVLNC